MGTWQAALSPPVHGQQLMLLQMCQDVFLVPSFYSLVPSPPDLLSLHLPGPFSNASGALRCCGWWFLLRSTQPSPLQPDATLWGLPLPWALPEDWGTCLFCSQAYLGVLCLTSPAWWVYILGKGGVSGHWLLLRKPQTISHFPSDCLSLLQHKKSFRYH